MYLKNCSYETIGDKDSQTVCYFFMAERINIEPVELLYDTVEISR